MEKKKFLAYFYKKKLSIDIYCRTHIIQTYLSKEQTDPGLPADFGSSNIALISGSKLQPELNKNK